MTFSNINDLKVAGLTAFSSIDYPGKLSAVVFVQGCPWRCLYCHNPQMQSRDFSEVFQHSSWGELCDLLNRRKGLLDAVVFSGGEPTLDPCLDLAIKQVKSMGFVVGLHTSGSYPLHLERLLPSIDWVGLDVKASLFDEVDYRFITGLTKSEPGRLTLVSLKLIQKSGIEYECRTTAHPSFLPEQKLLRLAKELQEQGVEHYALQIYRKPPHLNLPFRSVGYEYPSADLVNTLKKMFKYFELRRG